MANFAVEMEGRRFWFRYSTRETIVKLLEQNAVTIEEVKPPDPPVLEAPVDKRPPMGETAKMSVEQIAEACHERNREYCHVIGDDSQPAWADAPDWQKESAIAGVEDAISGDVTPEQSHESWLMQKAADGWVYGETKDAELKTHPCMVPYDELPANQRKKDAIFLATVAECVGACPEPPEAEADPTSSLLDGGNADNGGKATESSSPELPAPSLSPGSSPKRKKARKKAKKR